MHVYGGEREKEYIFMPMDISYKYPWIIQKGGQLQGRKITTIQLLQHLHYRVVVRVCFAKNCLKQVTFLVVFPRNDFCAG